MKESTMAERTKLVTFPAGEGKVGTDLFREVNDGKLTRFILSYGEPTLEGARSEIALTCEGALFLARVIEAELEILIRPGD